MARTIVCSSDKLFSFDRKWLSECEKHAEEIACVNSESDMEHKEVLAASFASTHEKDFVESVTKPNCSTADNEIREVISISSNSDFADYESCQQEGDGKSKLFHSFQSITDSSISLLSNLCGSTQYGNTELNVHKWDECESEVVAKLPLEINRLKRYKTICNVAETMMVSRDGRL